MGTLVGMAGLLGKLGVVAVLQTLLANILLVLTGSGHPLLSLQPLYTPNISSLVVRRVLQHCSPPLRPFSWLWAHQFHLPSCSLV